MREIDLDITLTPDCYEFGPGGLLCFTLDHDDRLKYRNDDLKLGHKAKQTLRLLLKGGRGRCIEVDPNKGSKYYANRAKEIRAALRPKLPSGSEDLVTCGIRAADGKYFFEWDVRKTSGPKPGIVSTLWLGQPRNPRFRGREAELTRLHAHLDSCRTGLKKVVVWGPSGAGKTQLALQYAEIHKDDFACIFWFTASTKFDILPGYEMAASELGIELPESYRPESVRREVIRRLRQKKWLMILDGMDSFEEILPFFPDANEGSLLITSQRRPTHREEHLKLPIIKLTRLRQEDAVLFFLEEAGYPVGGDLLPEELAAAQSIVAHTSRFPLEIRALGVSARKLREQFGHTLAWMASTNALKGSVEEKLLIDTYKPEDSVLGSAMRQLDMCCAHRNDLKEFRTICSFLNNELDLSLVRELHPRASDPLSSFGDMSRFTRDIVAPFFDWSLIDEGREGRYWMHSQYQEATQRFLLTEAERRDWAERIVQGLNTSVKRTDTTQWGHCHRLLPHARRGAQLVLEHGFVSGDAGELLEDVGTLLQMCDSYGEALPLLERALEIRQWLGEPIATSRVQNQMGLVQMALGRFQAAQEAFESALDVFESTPAREAESARKSAILNNLACVLRYQGFARRARGLYLQLVRELKPENPSGGVADKSTEAMYADAMQNLATLEAEIGNPDEALMLAEEALPFYEACQEIQPLRTAAFLDNYGALLAINGRDDSAEAAFGKSLKIKETFFAVLGSDVRPEGLQQLAISRSNLALLFARKGRLDECLQIVEQVAGDICALGFDLKTRAYAAVDIRVAHMFIDLASVYSQLDRPRDAQKMLEAGIPQLTKRFEAYGIGRNGLAAAYDLYASVLEANDRHEEAARSRTTAWDVRHGTRHLLN